jgi:hypothetical protein
MLLHATTLRRTIGILSLVLDPSFGLAISLACDDSKQSFFLESIFQDPCPTLNGTRRVTMPQVLTRRSGPITLLALEARSPAPTNPKAGSGSDHPGGRSPQSTAQFGLTLTARSHCSVSLLNKQVLFWAPPRQPTSKCPHLPLPYGHRGPTLLTPNSRPLSRWSTGPLSRFQKG